nr:hypothetical protein [Tanacetum cinerariifolium]
MPTTALCSSSLNFISAASSNNINLHQQQPIAKGVGLRVADSHTGEDPIRASQGRHSKRRGGYAIKPPSRILYYLFQVPQLPLDENRLNSKSFKDKLPLNIDENPYFQRLGRYPTSVRVFDDPVLFLAGLKPSWEFRQQRHAIIMGGKEITVDLGESPKAGVFIVHPGSVAARIKERKCKTRGGSSRPPLKRKLASGSSSSHVVSAKTYASKDDALILSISDDDEGKFPVHLVLLEDANTCHMKISAITPPAWKSHLDNQIDLELLDLHDHYYARQAVMDNAVNKRAHKFLQVIEKMREVEKARLEAVEASLRKEVEELKQDRKDVVLKVVPYATIELVAAMKEPFELSKAKGYRSSYKKEHTQASNDFSTATFPSLDEFIADVAAPIKALLLK